MKKNNVILTLAALVCCSTLWAQTSGNNSPYSRYGWGTLADESQSFNIGMGEPGTPYAGPHHSPQFRTNDAILKVCAATVVATALKAMEAKK